MIDRNTASSIIEINTISIPASYSYENSKNALRSVGRAILIIWFYSEKTSFLIFDAS